MAVLEMAMQILKDVLVTLYEQTGAAVVMTVLLMFAYMYVKKHGIKETVRSYIDNFRHDSEFRNFFFFGFYLIMLLFRTLFCRTILGIPTSNVLGVWGLHTADGRLYTENIENLMLFVPLIFLFMLVYHKKILKNYGLMYILWKSLEASSLFSFGIELTQLFLKIGTFQLSDLFFNTAGGIVSGFAFWAFYRIKKGKTKNE